MKSKEEIRTDIRGRMRDLGAEERLRETETCCEALLKDPVLRSARCIGIYLALPDELDLQTALAAWLRAGKVLAAPVFRDAEWSFRQCSDLRNLTAGTYNIREPEGEPIPVDQLDAILVPGRAFTGEGGRLGRGKGIYDRLLEGYKGTTLGIGFSCQVVSTLPLEGHDRILDRLYLPVLLPGS